MGRGVDVPLMDPRISPQMRAYLFKKGFRLKEYNGLLMVLGEEGGESVELGVRVVLRSHTKVLRGRVRGGM